MMRAHGLSIALVSALAIGALIVPRPSPALIWNATASTPIGLYMLQPTVGLHTTELVAIEPPKPIATFLANGGFLPEGGLLLKHVLALPGQIVCRFDRRITIDGIDAGEAKERDYLNRPLPVWSGCQTLQPDEVFLMNPAVPDSLDGRYFGPLPITAIVGQAMPLWTDEAGAGRHIWHPSDH